MYIHTNPNPNGVYVEDCVVRAISIVTGIIKLKRSDLNG